MLKDFKMYFMLCDLKIYSAWKIENLSSAKVNPRERFQFVYFEKIFGSNFVLFQDSNDCKFQLDVNIILTFFFLFI